VLGRETASFVVPVGGDAAEPKAELVEHVAEATQGPPGVDVVEARRAFDIGRKAAKEHLLMEDIPADYPRDSGLAPALTEFALADTRSLIRRALSFCARMGSLK
jgi:hypothetical protein